MPAPTPDDRLAALERAVLDLRREVDGLRAELAAERAGATPAPHVAPLVDEPATLEAPLASPPHDALDRRLTRPAAPASAGSFGARAAAYARAQAAGLGLPTPRAEPDFEALVGRYGTVAVAALFVLLAAGAFLTWAVANYDLSPAARVGLGALAAAALAGAGLYLRRRAGPADADSRTGAAAAGREERAGSRRFGDVLLALALAVTHVVTWAAGPYLGLVPPAAALAVAAVASAALAALAWRARQQSLFLVGVGGALLAPFVTGSADGSPTALRVYGWVVLSSALLAVPTDGEGRRRWTAAFQLLALGGASYTAAHFGGPLAMAVVGNPAGLALPGWMLARHAPVLFALAAALVPLGRAARERPPAAPDAPDPRAPLAGLALAYLASGGVALLTLATDGGGAAGWTLGLALAGTGLGYAALRPLTRRALAPATHDPGTARGVSVSAAATAIALPLLFLAAGLAGLDRVTGVPGAAVAALWSALAAAAAVWTQRQVARHASAPDAPTDATAPALPSAHAAASGLAAALVPVFLFSGRDVPRVVGLALVAGFAAQALRTLRHPLALLAPALTASAAAVWAVTLLENRTPYRYTPFVTAESLAAAAVVAAWGTTAARVWRDGRTVFPVGERRTVVGVATAVALGWGREELAYAVAPDVATVLLVAYFALAGIGFIALGRARHAPAARQIGLLLALYAAAKALLQASQLDAVGLRILSYLVVGGFFLGIGYWYRTAGTQHTPERHLDATSAT